MITAIEPEVELDLTELLDPFRLEGWVDFWLARKAAPSTVGNKCKGLSELFKWMKQKIAFKKFLSEIECASGFLNEVRQQHRRLNYIRVATSFQEDDLLEKGEWLTVIFHLFIILINNSKMKFKSSTLFF